jgi:hypothetical protein
MFLERQYEVPQVFSTDISVPLRANCKICSSIFHIQHMCVLLAWASARLVLPLVNTFLKTGEPSRVMTQCSLSKYSELSTFYHDLKFTI